MGGILGIGGSGRSEKSRSRSPSEVRIGEGRGVKGRLFGGSGEKKGKLGYRLLGGSD